MANSISNFVINIEFNYRICWKLSTLPIYLYFILMKIKSNPSLTVLSIIFGLLVFNYFLDNKIIFYLSIIISGIGVFSSKTSLILEKIWFKISYILSLIIPNILLFLLFFLILTPLSFLSKIFRAKSGFNLKKNQTTMFVQLNKKFNKDSFKRAW